jgi:hypothetical protein
MGKSKATTTHSCNILQFGASTRQLWQFSLSGGRAELVAESNASILEQLPRVLVAKTWRSLWHRKVNVAWLPADQVYLRVVRLPSCAPAELQSMVEMQLEKISPMPTNQVVWSLDVVPSYPTAQQPEGAAKSDDPDSAADTAAAMQTVVVVVAATQAVDPFLGQLENQGYMADRLEFPALHHLLTQEVKSDSVWIYPGIQENKNSALVAWWTSGILQHLSFLHLPADERWTQLFTEQMNQTAWAGQMESWLKKAPECHLVAESTVAAVWEPVIAEWAGAAVVSHPALKTAELAELSARRLARNESLINLLPATYSQRYRQQMTDRIWMRGLGALIVAYLVGVLGYFAALEVLKFQFGRVQRQVFAATPGYKSSQQLKAKVQVLQDRENLKYAALDCFKAAAELLPEDVTLNNLSFQRGKVLMLSGTAPADQVTKITEFNQALAGTTVRGQRLFRKVNPPNSQTTPNSQIYTWNFTCELQQTESE